jgi:hypothetical protein
MQEFQLQLWRIVQVASDDAYHIAKVVIILAIRADGELSKVSLRLCVVSLIGVSTATGEPPDQTSWPGGTHIFLPLTTVLERVTSNTGASTLVAGRDNKRTLIADVDFGSCKCTSQLQCHCHR